MSVTVVDKGQDWEIRKSAPRRQGQFPTSYLVFRTGVPNGERFDALGLARASVGKKRAVGAPKKKGNSKKN